MSNNKEEDKLTQASKVMIGLSIVGALVAYTLTCHYIIRLINPENFRNLFTFLGLLN